MVNIPYEKSIGSFTWAMINTHLDLAYSVGIISQYMANPGKLHWKAIKRIFRYIHGPSNYYIQYTKTTNPKSLLGYSDADWGGHLDTRRSTLGFNFILNGGAIN